MSAHRDPVVPDLLANLRKSFGLNPCKRHPLGELVVSIGSATDEDGDPVADQCADCIEEAEDQS